MQKRKHQTKTYNKYLILKEMKTKLISITLIILLSTSLAFSQDPDKGKTAFAILGGVNFQNLNGKNYNGDKLENDMIIGYHAGINVLIPLAPQFYFQPGLLFSTKGAKNSYGSLTGTFKLSYVEMPLNFVYRAALGNGKIMVGFGPYLGYAIGGKAELVAGDASVTNDILFQNTIEIGDPLLAAYFKRFDAGGNIYVAYEMAGGLFLQLNTQFGMVKINPQDNRISNDNSSVKNTGFGVSLGYRF
jgi:hypothetical protein